MEWVRLYVTTEGQTERKFAEEVLVPHLANYNIEVKAGMTTTTDGVTTTFTD